MIKEFLKEHPYLRLNIKYIKDIWVTNGLYESCWRIQLCDGTTVMFEHFILDTAIENLNVDFETAIMTPIISWYEQQMEEKK